ncbi:phosphocarrier protein HPr [Faecalibaculum rodentium]|uniref:phosphocarrier protein HPr n=1 Tax=Faecalibaculum rodentium TaxID=1702221 RepID=UPI0025744713|nr:phosphocarrier protein HPr [Faecalibaculum rodentium]
MKQVTVTVIDSVGLHARPATVAVNAASKFKSDVNVAFKGREVNMKSIMGVMSLGIPTQSEITISATGDDEEAAIEAIEEVLRAQKIIA